MHYKTLSARFPERIVSTGLLHLDHFWCVTQQGANSFAVYLCDRTDTDIIQWQGIQLYLIGLDFKYIFPQQSVFAVFFSLPSFQRCPSDQMSLMKTISFILLLSAVMLEGAPGRWDPQEGILTN